MTSMTHDLEHDEIDLLLPWYVNGTLHSLEHGRVVKHVAGCATCRESVSALSCVRSAVTNDKATPILLKPRIDELLHSIDAKFPLHRLDWRQPKITLAASAAALLLIFVLLFSLRQDVVNLPQRFETATAKNSAAVMEYVLSIEFEPGISVVNRERVLTDIKARDILSGGEPGAYRVTVQLPATSLEELERYTDDLESMLEIRSVTVVALHLPMRRP